MRRVFLGVNALMLCLFGFGAAVQWNDPDPLRWIAIYLAATLACGLVAAGRARWLVPALVGAVALVWALTLLPETLGSPAYGHLFDSFEMRDVEVEVAREALGLLIITAWMAVLAVRVRDGAA